MDATDSTNTDLDTPSEGSSHGSRVPGVERNVANYDGFILSVGTRLSPAGTETFKNFITG